MFRKWLIGAIGSCTVCDEHWEDYHTAQRQAADHAKRTGHLVILEATYACEYGHKQAGEG